MACGWNMPSSFVPALLKDLEVCLLDSLERELEGAGLDGLGVELT